MEYRACASDMKRRDGVSSLRDGVSSLRDGVSSLRARVTSSRKGAPRNSARVMPL